MIKSIYSVCLFLLATSFSTIAASELKINVLSEPTSVNRKVWQYKSIESDVWSALIESGSSEQLEPGWYNIRAKVDGNNRCQVNESDEFIKTSDTYIEKDKVVTCTPR